MDFVAFGVVFLGAFLSVFFLSYFRINSSRRLFGQTSTKIKSHACEFRQEECPKVKLSALSSRTRESRELSVSS
jgi:hypothetical protein